MTFSTPSSAYAYQPYSIASCEIDDTHVLLVWVDTNGTAIRSRVAILGDTITYGTELTTTFSFNDSYGDLSICKLSSTTFQVLIGAYQTQYKTFTLTLSGTTLTASSITTNTTSLNMDTIGGAPISRIEPATKYGTNTKCAFYSWPDIYTQTGYPYTTYYSLKIACLDSSVYSTQLFSTRLRKPTITALDNETGSSTTTRFLVTYFDNTGAYPRKAKVVTFNWSNHTFSAAGSEYTILSTDQNADKTIVIKLSTDKVLLGYVGDTGYIKYKVINISGNVITPGTEYSYQVSTVNPGLIEFTAISSSSVEVLWKSGTSPYPVSVYNIAITSDVIGSPTDAAELDSSAYAGNTRRYLSLSKTANYVVASWADTNRLALSEASLATNFEYSGSGSLSASSTSNYVQEFEYSSSGSISALSTTTSSYEDNTPTYPYDGSGSLSTSSTLSSEFTADYSFTGAGSLSASNTLDVSDEVFYTLSTSGQLTPSSTIESLFTTDYVKSTSGSITTSSTLSKSLNRNPPELIDQTTLLSGLQTKYIYHSCYVDSTTLLVVYDKNEDSGSTIYCREIDYTDAANPVIGEEQTLFTNFYTSSAKDPYFDQIDSYCGRIENGLCKNDSNKFTLSYYVTVASHSAQWFVKSLWITRSGSTYTGTRWGIEHVSQGSPNATTFEIDSDRFGIINGTHIREYKWVYGYNYYYPEVEKYSNSFSPTPNSSYASRVTRLSSLSWIVSYISSNSPYQAVVAKFSINASTRNISFDSTSSLSSVATRGDYCFRVIITSSNIYCFFTEYVSATRFAFKVAKFDLSLSYIETKTIYEYTGSSPLNYNVYISGAEKYSDNLFVLNMNLSGFQIDYYSSGYFVYNYSTNSISFYASTNMESSIFDQNCYSMENSNVVGLYGLNSSGSKSLISTTLGINYSLFIYSSSGSLTTGKTSAFDWQSLWTTLCSGSLSTISSTSHGYQTDFIKSTSGSMSASNTLVTGLDFDVTCNGSISTSSTSSFDYLAVWDYITSGSINISASGAVAIDREFTFSGSLYNSSTSNFIWTKDFIISSSGGLTTSYDSNALFTRDFEAFVSGSMSPSATVNLDWDTYWSYATNGLITGSSTLSTQWGPVFTFQSSGSLTSESSLSSSWDTYWEIISSGSLESGSSSSSDFYPLYEFVSSGSMQAQSSSILGFIANWTKTTSGYLHASSTVDVKVQDYHYVYDGHGSLSTSSDSIYDFIRSYAYLGHGDLDIDALAVSLYDRVFEYSGDGLLTPSSTSDYFYQEIRPLWEYSSSGNLVLTSQSKGYLEERQVVFCITPITGLVTSDARITGLVTSDARITKTKTIMMNFMKRQDQGDQ